MSIEIDYKKASEAIRRYAKSTEGKLAIDKLEETHDNIWCDLEFQVTFTETGFKFEKETFRAWRTAQKVFLLGLFKSDSIFNSIVNELTDTKKSVQWMRKVNNLLPYNVKYLITKRFGSITFQIF